MPLSSVLTNHMSLQFRVRLSATMILDVFLCYIVEHGCKALFADLQPKEFVTRGIERRLRRRIAEREVRRAEIENGSVEKKTQ